MHDSVVVGNLLGEGRIGLLDPTRTRVFSFRLSLHPKVKMSWREAGRSLQSKVTDKNACSYESNHT